MQNKLFLVLAVGACLAAASAENPNKPPNEPGRPDKDNCDSRNTRVVGACAANMHGGLHSCEAKCDIDWAKVHTQTSKGDKCTEHHGEIPVTWSVGDGAVFAYDESTITVAGGCRANMLVCCKDTDDSQNHGCPGWPWKCNLFCRTILKCRCGGFCNRFNGDRCTCMGCPNPKNGPRTCSCHGDPHMTTFRGDKYTLGSEWARRDKRSVLEYRPNEKKCDYYLLKDADTNIISNNVGCQTPGGSCIYSVTIIHKSTIININHDKTVKVNGASVPMPLQAKEFSIIVMSERYVACVLDNNITVAFDGEEAVITDQSDKESEGLCGSNDGNEKNEVDFTRLKEFTEKWKVDPACKD